MVRSLGAALLMAMLGAGCATMAAHAASSSLIGEWVVEDVDHAGVADGAHLTVAFDETGRIYGSAGCNRYTGAYTYDASTGALKVTPLGVTRRLCPPALMTQEGRLVQSLQGVTRADTQADGAVSLVSGSGRTLLRRASKATQAAARAPTPKPATVAAAPAYDPLAPKAPTSTAPVSPTALPPPSTSSYALSGGPTDTAAPPLYPPAAPVAPAATTTTARVSTSPVTATVKPPPATAPTAPTVTPAPVAAPSFALGPPAVSPRITASGEIYYLEQIALPPGATVRVQLRDVSRAGAPATVLGQQEFSASGGQPFRFSVTAPSSVIAPSARLTLFAQILSGNRLLFISDTSNPVPATGASAPLRIRVVNAAPAPTRPTAPAPLPASTSGAAPATLPPISVAPAAIPNSVWWRCGVETFRLAFEAQTAFLTTADGAVARLARINASDEPGAPQMFSNSILTVIREPDGGRVRFARGRMALTSCARGE